MKSSAPANPFIGVIIVTDLEAFIKMETIPRTKGYRRWGGRQKPSTYVCTICGKVQLPTFDRNVRCNRCSAPLIMSMENIVSVQRLIKDFQWSREEVDKLRVKINSIRSMKHEYFDLKTALKNNGDEKKVVRKKRVVPKGDFTEVLIFNLYIPARYHPPKGFSGNIRVPSDELETFKKKCVKVHAEVKLVASENEWQAMDNIRRAMMEVADK